MPDVVIIGGGLHGCSTAFHLLRREPSLTVVVIERDATYTRAASALSHAGLRLLWSQEENLAMSLYGQEFFGNFADLCEIAGEPAYLDFWRQGYLFIANTAAQADAMEANFRFQQKMGADTQLLSGVHLQDLYPGFNTSDVICANYGPNDGWIDPYGALTGLRRKVQSMGADFVNADVIDIECSNDNARRAVCSDGRRIDADFIVNTAGAWAYEICAMMGFDIPVRPLHRTTFYFEPAEPQPTLPQTLDGQPAAFRQQGAGFLTGLTQFERSGSFCWEPDYKLFEQTIWPRIARRYPAFTSLKLKNAWACHYAQNLFDGNMLIGSWPGQPANFLISTGFSGHGLQHAPAAGRALSELILDGRFETIDLERFHARRVTEGRPEPESGVKA